MSRDQRNKPKIPKRRIPVAPLGIRHRSKKDYKRNNKVEIPVDERHMWDDDLHEAFVDAIDHWTLRDKAEDDLLWVLSRLNIKSAYSYRRVASYK